MKLHVFESNHSPTLTTPGKNKCEVVIYLSLFSKNHLNYVSCIQTFHEQTRQYECKETRRSLLVRKHFIEEQSKQQLKYNS